jgi:hypothetical protein
MGDVFIASWSDPRVKAYGGEPRYKHQVRFSFGLEENITKRGYMVVRYDVLRTYLPEEVLVHGLTREEAVGFEKLLKE